MVIAVDAEARVAFCVANVPCVDCGMPTTVAWAEAVYRGHNYATLYECECGAVIMLADLFEGGVDDLRKLEEHQ